MTEAALMAKALSPEVDAVAQNVLPEVKDEAGLEGRPEVVEKARAIDIGSVAAITTYAAGIEGELQAITDEMITGVRSRDAGEAGKVLGEMVTTLRGFELPDEQLRDKPNWFERQLSMLTPYAKFFASFENVESQIERISDGLLEHEKVLLTKIMRLDRVYTGTLEYFHALGLDIAAGELRIKWIDEQDIPAQEASIEAAETDDAKMLASQGLRDLRQRREALVLRIHDLKLTRQGVMQALPTTRNIQEIDRLLLGKIASIVSTTVPVWKIKIAEAISIQEAADAGAAVSMASDFTNELFAANAAAHRETSAMVRREAQRGIIDIDTLKFVNEQLIGTIEDGLRIEEEGKAARTQGDAQLKEMEADLRKALASAKAPA